MNICYLGNSIQEYTDYRKVFPQAETVFLCSDYLQLLRLESYNERVQVYDDHVPGDRARPAEQWLCNLLQTWYLDGEGHDLSALGGVSLGRVAQYYFVQLLTEEMRLILSVSSAVDVYHPDVLAWGASLGEGLDRACSSLAATSGIPVHRMGNLEEGVSHLQERLMSLEEREGQADQRNQRPLFRLWERLTSVYAAIQDFLSSGSTGHPYDVLVVNHPSLDPVWNEWNADSRLRARIRLGFLSNFPPGKGIAIRALFRRCTVYPVASKPSKLAQHREVEPIIRSVEAHMESETWRSRLLYGNLDLTPILTPVFQKAISWVFPLVASLAFTLEDTIRRRRPKAVLLPYTSPPNTQILWRLSSTYGFKTVGVEHGIGGSPDPSADTMMGETWELDRFIIANDADRDVRERWGIPPEKIIVLGSGPAQRIVDHIERQGPKQRSNGQTGQVLVLHYNRLRGTFSHKERTCEEFFFRVIDLLHHLGHKKIIYKLHPGPDHLAYFDELKQYLKYPLDLTIVQDAPIFDLMEQADFIVGPPSTAILEAAVLDRPYLCVHLDDVPQLPPLDTEEVPLAHNYDEMARLIQNRDDIWPIARRAILRDIGGLDPDHLFEGDRFGKKLLMDISDWLDSAEKPA